jgi:hypothetical protein
MVSWGSSDRNRSGWDETDVRRRRRKRKRRRRRRRRSLGFEDLRFKV